MTSIMPHDRGTSIMPHPCTCIMTHICVMIQTLCVEDPAFCIEVLTFGVEDWTSSSCGNILFDNILLDNISFSWYAVQSCTLEMPRHGSIDAHVVYPHVVDAHVVYPRVVHSLSDALIEMSDAAHQRMSDALIHAPGATVEEDTRCGNIADVSIADASCADASCLPSCTSVSRGRRLSRFSSCRQEILLQV